jgi:hypothetical protein
MIALYMYNAGNLNSNVSFRILRQQFLTLSRSEGPESTHPEVATVSRAHPYPDDEVLREVALPQIQKNEYVLQYAN